MAYAPKPGYDWNPLRSFRNVPCPCGSQKKAKRCHGALDVLPLRDVIKMRAYLRMIGARTHGR